MKEEPLTDLEWHRIHLIREAAYHGQRPQGLSVEEQKLCQRAIAQDKDRYYAIGDDLRKEYRDRISGTFR